NFALLSGSAGHPGVVAMKVAAPQSADPERAVPLTAAVPGSLPPRGTTYAYYWFDYPGDSSVYIVNLQVAPNQIVGNTGFRVYGPQKGTVYVTGVPQSSLVPNVSGNLVSRD